MNNLILNNSLENNFVLRENTHLIINEFLGKEVIIDVLENTKAQIILFTANNTGCSININLKENASLNLDLIFLNENCINNINALLVGEYADLNLNLLSLAKNAKKEFDINVMHLARETKSSVTNNGICFDNGKNIFNVNGIIKPNMKNSDVRQITKGLILSPSGECVANPNLLIDFYDVKAYHGATIGKISDDDLFYLMSRGLTKNEAFMLVINGLLEPYIKDIEEESIKNSIMSAYFSYFKGE